MFRINKCYLIVLILVNLLTVHCFGVTKTFPEKKYFLIEAPEQTKLGESTKPFTFLIRKVSVSQKFEGKEFVYRKDNVNYESDFYHAFFIPPATNIREEISKAFLNSKLFEWDANLHSRTNVTHYIEIYISQLYGDFRTKTPLAILDFEVVVYAEKDFSSSPVYRKTFKQAIQIAEQAPESLVTGWNEGLQKSIQILIVELAQKLK